MTAPAPDHPPERLGPLSAQARAAILEGVAARTVVGLAWAERLRRFASLSGRNLGRVARKRFGAEASEHLAWMARVLLTAARIPADARPVDQAMLNGALYCLDHAPHALAPEADALCAELESWLAVTSATPLAPPAMGAAFAGDTSIWRAEAGAEGIVIICPSPFSLNALSVYAILRRLDVPVAAVVLRRFTLARLRSEWQRDGKRLLRKIWRKLLLRADENPDASSVSLRSVCDRLELRERDIRRWARADSVPVIDVDEFEDAVPLLGAIKPRIAIFTGGGMIRQSVLDIFPIGIVNVHMGSLPQHKGMDVVQAPILEGNFDDIALTAHLMERRLDRGPVLSRFSISSDGYSSLGSLRNELSAMSPLLGVDAALGCLSGRLVQEDQPEAGRQYYFVHPRLTAVLTRVLAARHRRDRSNAVAPVVDRAFRTIVEPAS